ncbi:MAG: hypothetical protein HOP30_05585 [Cyclobacteriaceae bacterium]|nr:hypothetical protein [Cyclobacteriaceae bacterium]
MPDAKKTFHIISYLQYPFMIVSIYYCYRQMIMSGDVSFPDINKGLMFLGLGVSFSTLQDTTKTQNNISKRVFENPKYAQRFIFAVAMMIAFFIGIGLFGTLISNNSILNELAIGCLGLGIGMMGMLKAVIEMAEHHRKP